MRSATWRYCRTDTDRAAFMCDLCRREFGPALVRFAATFGVRIRWASLPVQLVAL